MDVKCDGTLDLFTEKLNKALDSIKEYDVLFIVYDVMSHNNTINFQIDNIQSIDTFNVDLNGIDLYYAMFDEEVFEHLLKLDNLQMYYIYNQLSVNWDNNFSRIEFSKNDSRILVDFILNENDVDQVTHQFYVII
jgi:hypothetical protein